MFCSRASPPCLLLWPVCDGATPQHFLGARDPDLDRLLHKACIHTNVVEEAGVACHFSPLPDCSGFRYLRLVMVYGPVSKYSKSLFCLSCLHSGESSCPRAYRLEWCLLSAYALGISFCSEVVLAYFVVTNCRFWCRSR